jgi:hypothetical protein
MVAAGYPVGVGVGADRRPEGGSRGMAGQGGDKRTSRQRAKLERKLGDATRRVEKRTRKLDKVTARHAAGQSNGKRLARRTKKLDAATTKQSDIAGRLAALDGSAPTRTAKPPKRTPKKTAGVEAYCLRERRRTTIADPKPVVLSNGREALAGTCSSCGARMVRLGR